MNYMMHGIGAMSKQLQRQILFVSAAVLAKVQPGSTQENILARIKAVTFDLWDTVFDDDSDEPKRIAQGLKSKALTRRELIFQALNKHAPIDPKVALAAYNTSEACFNDAWHRLHFTWTVRERLQQILTGLERDLPEADHEALVTELEEMELRIPPDLIPGVDQAIRALQKDYKLVVISDAIFSPGRVLREILQHYNLRDAFSGFVFSDEAGAAKPDRSVFAKAAAIAGCQVEELVHLGDREHNDIQGPKEVGARAVLITAAKDRGSDKTQADAICKDMHELPGLIAELSTGE